MSRTIAIVDHAFAPIEDERRIAEEAGATLITGETVEEDGVIALAREADAILCDGAPISERVLTALPRVRVVSEYGIGYDNIDVAAATRLGVWVANVPGFCTTDVATHTLAMALALLRNLVPFDRAVRTGGWGATSQGAMRRPASLTFGVVGFGRIGQAVASRAKALGFRVVAWSPRGAALHGAALGVEPVGLAELLARSDFVSLHVPVTPTTRGLIDRAAIAGMKPGARLINTGRGALVDEVALVEALASGHLSGAALDVFSREPVPADSPLLTREDVLFTPHAAFYSEESLLELQVSAMRNAIAVLDGGAPFTPVNPEVSGRLRVSR